MDKDGIKTAIREELGRKVAMSGGPEVFRRLVRGDSALVEAALQELVQEGLLSETRLRVGKVYHYPANTATRLDILAGFMKKMAEAPARPARPAHAAAPAAGRDPAAPGPVRTAVTEGASTPAAASEEAPAAPMQDTAAPVPVAEGEKAAWVPKRATPRDPNKPRPVPRTAGTPGTEPSARSGPPEEPAAAPEAAPPAPAATGPEEPTDG